MYTRSHVWGEMVKMHQYHSRVTCTRASGHLAFSWFEIMNALLNACTWCAYAWFAKWLLEVWDLCNFSAADSDFCKTGDLKWLMVIFHDVSAPTWCTNDGDPNHVLKYEFSWCGHLHACKWPFDIFAEILSRHEYMMCWLHDGTSGSCVEVLDEQEDAFLMMWIGSDSSTWFDKCALGFSWWHCWMKWCIWGGQTFHALTWAFWWCGHLYACKWPLCNFDKVITYMHSAWLGHPCYVFGIWIEIIIDER